MSNDAVVSGENNIVLQGITESTVTIQINGKDEEIKKDLQELKKLLKKYKTAELSVENFNINIEDMDESDFGFITANVAGRKNFNEFLTKEIITALQGQNDSARKFLEIALAKNQNWEKVDNISNTGKELIAISFVGIIGTQIRKLMAIGKEELNTLKINKYLNQSCTIARRLLQLTAFTLLSELWNKKLETSMKIEEQHQAMINGFFTDSFGGDILTFFKLCQSLISIFQSNDFELPLDELNKKENTELFKNEGPLHSSLINLSIIKTHIEAGKVTLLTCFRAEKELTNILKHLIFFAQYNMVSIKSISYEEMRNSPPKFLHSFAQLGMDRKANINLEQVDYKERPAGTESILLYKDNFLESINLFPFILDLNALKLENGSRIYFYHSRDFQDESLNYEYVEDQSIENITNSKTIEKNLDINTLIHNKAARIALRMDFVIIQFENAMNTLSTASQNDISLNDIFN